MTYQQSVSKRYHSDKHFQEFCIQDGGENQLALIWNLRYCHPMHMPISLKRVSQMVYISLWV